MKGLQNIQGVESLYKCYYWEAQLEGVETTLTIEHVLLCDSYFNTYHTFKADSENMIFIIIAFGHLHPLD